MENVIKYGLTIRKNTKGLEKNVEMEGKG